MQIEEIISVIGKSNLINGNKINEVFNGFFDKLNFDSREKLFESIIKYYDSTPNLNQTRFVQKTILSINQILDLRIIKMQWSAMRCFESRPPDKLHNIEFGQNNQATSTIIYGTNGAGKSTIFDALEYIYTGQISELRARQIDTPSKKDHLRFLERFEDEGSLYCSVKTISNTLDINSNTAENLKQKYAVTTNNNFIGQWRVSQSQTMDFSATKNQSLEQFIANGMGMDQHLKVYNAVKDLTTYKRAKEKRELKTIVESLDESSKLINIWQNDLALLKTQMENSNPLVDMMKISFEAAQSMIEIIGNVKPLKINNDEVFAAMRDFLLRFHQYKESKVSLKSQRYHQLLTIAKELIDNNSKECPICGDELHIENAKKRLDTQLDKLQHNIATVNNLKDSFVGMVNLIKYSKQKVEDQVNSAKHMTAMLSQNADFKHIFDTTRQYQNHLQKILHEELFDTLMIKEGYPTQENYDAAYRILYYEYEVVVSHIEHFNKMTLSIEAIISEQIIHVKTLIDKKGGATICDSLKDVGNKILLRQGQIDEEMAKMTELQRLAAIANAKVEHQKKVFAEIQAYSPLLEKEIKQHIATHFEPMKDFLIQIMDVFLEKDDLTIDINCDIDAAYSPNDSAQSLSIDLINKTTLEKINPSKYFNTFRYKLFCSSISCALALSIKQNNNINLPLVLDDPFDGFDTQNSELMNDFIEQILKINTQFRSKENPLQIIMLTHDWQLFNLFKAKLNTKAVKFMILNKNTNYTPPLI